MDVISLALSKDYTEASLTGAGALKGEKGDPGNPGVGVPAGGESGQVLAKASGTDYETKWVDPPSGGGSDSGEDGATFTPSVSEDGTLSWTNDKGLANPSPVNIMGPEGPQGIQGIQGIKGDQGEQGVAGPAGAAAGFGTPTATGTTLEAGSEATVSVTATGDDTAKVFAFEFGIPRGADGAGGSGGEIADVRSINVYSVEERVVGTWLDGKPIYRKCTFTTTQAGVEDIPIISLTSDNYDTIVNIMFHTTQSESNNTYKYFANYHNSSSAYAYAYIKNDDVRYGSGSSYAFGNTMFIAEYTKTTDPATIDLPDEAAMLAAYKEGVQSA